MFPKIYICTCEISMCFPHVLFVPSHGGYTTRITSETVTLQRLAQFLCRTTVLIVFPSCFGLSQATLAVEAPGPGAQLPQVLPNIRIPAFQRAAEVIQVHAHLRMIKRDHSGTLRQTNLISSGSLKTHVLFKRSTSYSYGGFSTSRVCQRNRSPPWKVMRSAPWQPM